jgi:hypothetical protein
MAGHQTQSKPDVYWDRAGGQVYGQAICRSADVETHVRGLLWRIATEITEQLRVPHDGAVIHVGCGDGALRTLTSPA